VAAYYNGYRWAYILPIIMAIEGPQYLILIMATEGPPYLIVIMSRERPC
jgi:hypothetical protein